MERRPHYWPSGMRPHRRCLHVSQWHPSENYHCAPEDHTAAEEYSISCEGEQGTRRNILWAYTKHKNITIFLYWYNNQIKAAAKFLHADFTWRKCLLLSEKGERVWSSIPCIPWSGSDLRHLGKPCIHIHLLAISDFYDGRSLVLHLVQARLGDILTFIWEGDQNQQLLQGVNLEQMISFFAGIKFTQACQPVLTCCSVQKFHQTATPDRDQQNPEFIPKNTINLEPINDIT